MNKALKWGLALIITFLAAHYQRTTGPTYPMSGEVTIGGKTYSYTLPRSHGGFTPQIISLQIADTTIHAQLHYKRYKLKEEWTVLQMRPVDGTLQAELPPQPPAGKLEYYITLSKGNQTINLPEDNAVVIRFKGEVPLYVLIPHILMMFLSMLLGSYAGIEALTNGSNVRFYTLLTTIFIFIGGMILGPIVQKLAFGAFWTGIPFGYDLTDNKTLIALLAWVIAYWRISRSESKSARWWVVAATVVMMLVFLIPHSMMGSELNYQTMQVETGK